MASLSRLVGRLFGVAPRLQIHPGVSRGGTSVPVGPVLVVGGGIAGMSAALVLAERGVPVCVYEAAPRLGGRLDATIHHLPDGTTQPVDHGFHGFFRQYYNWRSVLSRIDLTGRLLQPLGSYPVISRRWPDEQFDRLPSTPPISIAALLARSPSLRLRELIHANHRAARHLLAFDTRRTYRQLDHLSAEAFMASLDLTERANAMLFNVFAHSFFDDPANMSAAELVAMFHFYFLANPEGLGMDAPHGDYQSAIWDPLRQYLERHGGRVRTDALVTRLLPAAPTGWQVHLATGEQIEIAHVVLAVDARSAGTLLARSPEVTIADSRLARFAERPLCGPPYAVARYWLSSDVHPDRAPFTSIGGADLLDSVSLYHRIEHHARRWHQHTGGAVVELHAYACPDHVTADKLGEMMLTELADLWPEVTGLATIDQRCRIGYDAAGAPVGAHAHRPGVRSRLPGLSLAGDWVSLPVPAALMERAATSGIMAANSILARHGHPVEPIWSVPTRGLLARTSEH
ncbi:FAD-dependent oxidoreductase [Micromonospora sp. NPDC049559]|uniref:FAD-dependent oxidoreductase n=1 Tax=Micromonospora sp. NPDC049559 TaxID=3155923 RepID=UPI0034345FB6